MTIMSAFMIVTITLLLVTSMLLYSRFSLSSHETIIQNTQSVMKQTQENLEDYLVSMRRISDAVNFNVIAEYDVSNPSLEREMSLIYESYKDRLISIALYDRSGSLIASVPVVSQKTEPNVTKQAWFIAALSRIENMHFSTPHIQNLFDDATYSYHRVISLSRAVDITDSEIPKTGVLLVDMNYSSVAQILEQINSNKNGQ